MDPGWGVNEVICICPKLFAVDCFEGETAKEEKKKNALSSRAERCHSGESRPFWVPFFSQNESRRIGLHALLS